MAKNRYVNTHFWDDSFVMDSDPIEKLLFLYFITNPLTNIAGAYEIHLRQVALHTGIDRDMIVKILIRFEEADKIIYRDGWILITNFIKHQAKNPKIQKGIESAVSDCPQWIKDRLYIAYESLSKPLNNLNCNPNSNSNNNSNGNVNVSPEVETLKNTQPNAKDFDFPLKEYFEAFPETLDLVTPSQLAILQSVITNKTALENTILIYQGNLDRARNRYLPEKVGNFISTYKSEADKVDKANGHQNSKDIPTTAELKAELEALENGQR